MKFTHWRTLAMCGAMLAGTVAAAAESRVFAHFMICMPYNGEVSVEAYKYQIALAQRHGIDGFALNCGSWEKDPYYIERSTLMHEAAKQLGTDFKLFFSIDTASKIPVKTTALDMMRRFYNHPNEFRHQGRVVLSAYTSEAYISEWSDASAALKAAGYDVCFVPFVWTANHTLTPSYDGALNSLAAMPNLDGYFLFGIDAPVWDLIQGNRNCRRATAKHGQLYMATASFAYNSANLRDFHGLRDYAAMWENLIADRADWVELVTWNDFGEDSHLAPAAQFPGPSGRPNGMIIDHDESYLDFTAYCSAWFKSGTPPPILQEKIYYFYRNRPKWLRRVYDEKKQVWTELPDQIHDDVQDNLYATALLKEPAELTLAVGSARQTFALPAGVSHVELPFQSGVPTFELKRAGQSLLAVNGSQEIVGQPTKINSRLGYRYSNKVWSGAFCLGEATRLEPAALPAGETGRKFTVNQLPAGTYNLRVHYANATADCRWTLSADGTELKQHCFPVYMPPTGGQGTVAFLWSLTEKTTTLTLRREADDLGEAELEFIELVPVAPVASPAPRATAVEPELVAIPAGSFVMGSTSGEPDEAPAHSVTVSAFQMAKHEVTNAEFERFTPEHRRYRDEYSWRDTDPVIYVSWRQAALYCNWLSQQAGLPPAYDSQTWEAKLRAGYRLPTEAEWEYVASGRGEGRRYPWGDAAPDSTRGNFQSTGTTPVGSFPAGASRDGILDLAGNVFEWCTDCYHPYVAAAQTDPCPLEPSPYRSIRGGSWGYYGASQRTTDREFNSPVYPGFYYGGFRVVLPAR